VRYLKILSGNPEFVSDERVFDRLTEKVTEINHLRKEAETVLNLFDPQKEEEFIGESILQKKDPNKILETPSGNSEDLEFLQFLESLQVNETFSTIGETNSNPSQKQWRDLYTEKDFFLEGYKYIRSKDTNREDPLKELEIHPNFFVLRPNEEIKRRLGSIDSDTHLIYGSTALPAEVWKVSADGFQLSDVPHYVKSAIETAKLSKEKGHWTNVSYLNRQNPFLGWLNERLLMEFSKGEAPLISSPHFPEEELIYIFIGQISSVMGDPLLVLPHGIRMMKNGKFEAMTLEEVYSLSRMESILNQKETKEMQEASLLLPLAYKESLNYLKKEMESIHKKNQDNVIQKTREIQKEIKKRKNLIHIQRAKYFQSETSKVQPLDKQVIEMEAYYKERIEFYKQKFEHNNDPMSELVLVIEGQGK